MLRPAIYALGLWWLTTGVILYLDGLPRSTFRWSMTGATAVLLAAAAWLRISSQDVSAVGAYGAFTAAVLIWGWVEMSFLMGFITGPRRHGCPERCSGWRHFVHAAQAIAYNEASCILLGAAIVALTWHAANPVAAWTYGTLWVMRLSAKLNLFLGVANIGEGYLPAHLRYLRSFFRRRPMNLLFPVSITAGTLALGLLAQRFARATDGLHLAGYALVATLLALALLEHWFMVLPLPSEKLWGWALRQSGRRPPDAGTTPVIYRRG